MVGQAVTSLEIKSKGGEGLDDDVLATAFVAPIGRVATIAMIRVRNIVVIPFSFVYWIRRFLDLRHDRFSRSIH
jgi:hypothetical protein